MPLIAMTREMGSLGMDVAKQLESELRVPIVYHEIIGQLADKMRLRNSHVIRLLSGKAGILERLTADRTSEGSAATQPEPRHPEGAARANVPTIRLWGIAGTTTGATCPTSSSISRSRRSSRTSRPNGRRSARAGGRCPNFFTRSDASG